MGKIKQLSQHQQEQQRLALLALLADRPRPSAQCLSDATLAALVEGNLGKDEVEACLAHLAECEQCMQLWLQVDHYWQNHRRRTREGERLRFFSRPKVLTVTGSLLAVAASIAVFVTITTRMDHSLVVQQPLPQSPTAEAMREDRIEREQPVEPLPMPAGSQRQTQGPQTTTRDLAGNPLLAPPQHGLVGQQRMEIERKKNAQKMSHLSRSEEADSGRNFLAQKAETASIPHRILRAQAPAPLDGTGIARQSELETWKEELRTACEQSPATQLPARFTEQGKKLLVDGTIDPEQQILVQSLLAQIARDDTPAQSCRQIIALLDPKKHKEKQ